MQPETLNILEKGQVPAPKALALAQAIETELGARCETVATKADMAVLGARCETLATKADVAVLGARCETFATKVDLAELRAELHEVKSGLVRWIFLVILGQTAVLAGAGYFFIGQLVR
jgi:hypothetical protein